MLQLLLFSGLAFFIMLPMMKRTLTISLDFDWFYRYVGVELNSFLIKVLGSIITKSKHSLGQQLSLYKRVILRYLKIIGTLVKTTALSSMVQWVTILLSVYLVVFLFL